MDQAYGSQNGVTAVDSSLFFSDSTAISYISVMMIGGRIVCKITQ